jgi:RND family efflux transporter MFP subunit
MSVSKSRLTSILAAAGALGAALVFGSATGEQGSPAERGRRVTVAEVSAGRLERLVGFPGVTRAADRAELSFLVGGRLAERPVQVGDRVARGQLLARLDQREVHNGVMMAEADHERAVASRRQLERDLERSSALLAAKAATTEEVEKIRTGLDAATAAEGAADAALAEARRRRQEAELRAPYAGVITAVFAEPGENVTSGKRIVSLSGSSALEIEVHVPESVAAELGIDEPVRVSFPNGRRDHVSGTITSLAREAFGAGALFPVTVSLPAREDLVAGLTTRVELDLGLDQALLVPVAAVVDPGGRRPSVFRIAAGKAERIRVEVSSFQGDQVAVVGPLQAGDLVVVGGQRGLLDGEAVEIAR